MRAIKVCIGIALLPACFATTHSLGDLLLSLSGGSLSGIPHSVWGLVIGFVLWLLCYMVLPRPLRTYVLAHELTHALWGWAMGAKVKGLKVSARGGQVRLTHTNVLITLAPYFFPFYTMLVITLHAVLSIFFDLSAYEPVWMGWVGLTWGFHFTFTLYALRLAQPDIAEHGRIFSYVLIYLLNVWGICAWVVVVSQTAWNYWLPDWLLAVAASYQWLAEWVVSAIRP